MSSESSHSSGISTQAKEKTTQDEQDQTEQQSQSQQPEHQQESGQDHEQPEAQADEQSQEDELSGEEEDGTEGGLKENTTVFVRSIPFESTEQDIVGFFSQCGTISNVKLLHDPHTRRFKGCCFLRFETAEAANSACQLNETTWMGRKLYISMSLNKQAAPTTSPHVFIGNLDASSDLQSLQEFFSQCGTVLGIKLITDKVTQRNRGFGFVEFADMEAAKKSLELNGTMLGSRPIRIDFQRSKWRPRVSPGAGKAVTNGSGRTLLHRPGGPAGRFSRGHHPVAIASPHHPHPHHVPAPHHPHHHPHHPLHHPHHPHSAPPPPSHPHPHHPHHPPPHHHPHHPHQIPWDPNSVPPAYRAHFPRHPTHFAPPPALLPPASLPLGPNQPSSPASPGSSPTATGTSPTSTGAGGPATGPSAAIGAAGLPSQTGAPTGQGAPNSAMPAASPMAPPPPHAIPHFHPNQPPHRGGHPFFAPPNPFPFYPGYFAMDGGFPGFGYPSFTPDLMSENFEVRDATTPGGPSHKPATSHRSPPAATEAPHIPYQLDPYSHFFPPTTRPIAAPFSPTPYDTPDLVTPK